MIDPQQSQTRIFSQRVRTHMRKGLATVTSTTNVRELLGHMAAAKTTSALVVDDEGRLTGIVTEHDVARRIALRCSGDESVAGVMSSPVQHVRADDYLYHAIARMRRFGWRHMPVTDDAGHPLGVINLDDALAVAAERSVQHIDRLSQEGGLDGLREIKASQAELAEYLLNDSVPAPEIQALISAINRDLHTRILDAHIAAMANEGRGEPPLAFCLIIMGSGGRDENFLYPDQDNGFILDNYPDSEHDTIDGYFIELAERMTRDLDRVGFPYCNGWVMATNPLWRKTRQQWRSQVTLWGRKRGVIALQFSDIFFDFSGAYGDLEMAHELRSAVTALMTRSPIYLSALQQEIAGHGVALGWFGRFVTEKKQAENRGKLDLKLGATMPLVSNLRLLALREGLEQTGTLSRINGLHARGTLSRDEADYLSGAYRHITGLLLRQQIADVRAGRPVGNHVDPSALSERERDMLVNAMQAIDQLRQRVHSEFTANVF